MFLRVRFASSALVLAFVLSACGGGGGGSSLLGGGSSGSGSPGGGGTGPTSGSRTIAMTLTIPSPGTGTTSTGRSIVSTASSMRKPATISSSTVSISVSVNGGTPQIFNAAAPTCTGSPLTCTLNVGAPYGLDSFLIITYSGPNGTGTPLNEAAVTINVSASGPNSAAATAGTIIQVNDSADGSGGTFSCASGSTTCTLREAVAEAATGGVAVTAITFASGITSITLAQANGAIQIGSSSTYQIVEILGPGASASNPTGSGAPSASSGVTISGGGQTQIFFVNTGSGFTVDGVTLSGGSSTDSYGGAIESYGVLAIANSTFSGNTVTGSFDYGGAVYDDSPASHQSTVVASTFTGNSVPGYGGAYYVEYNSAGTMFAHNLFNANTSFVQGEGNDGYGGAIYTAADVSIDSSTFTGNVAGSKTVGGTYGYGGAVNIDNGTTGSTITNSTFGGSSASAGNYAGSPSNSEAEGGAIYNDSGLTVTLSGNTFSNNAAKGGYDAYGGAIYDSGVEGVVSTGDTFSNNVADQSIGTNEGEAYGGAIFSRGITSYANDTFTGNQALAVNGSNYGYAYGGAIYTENTQFTATQTTFSNNTASGGECDGGGVYTYTSNLSTPLTLTNVQFTNNTCTAGSSTNYPEAYGGGLEFDAGNLNFSNVTFSGNTATATASGTYYSEAYGGGFEYSGGSCGECSVARKLPPNTAAAATRHATVLAANLAREAQHFAQAQAVKTQHASRKSRGAVRKTSGSRTPQTIAANQMSNVTFTNNTASGNGGSGGSGAFGGGADFSGYPTFTNVSFTGNTASASGTGGPYSAGGGLAYGDSSCSNPTITATFTGNTAMNAGGGILSYCGMTITNSTISGNRVTNAQFLGDGGGGFWIGHSTGSLTQSTVSGNTVAASSPIAGSGGGGVMNYDSTMTVTNATVSGNQSAIDGGGMENGAGCCSGTISYLTNVTVYQNSALGKGGSIDNENAGGNNYFYIENSIFAGGAAPAGAEIANLDTFVSYGGNLIQGSVSGTIPANSQGIADILGVSPALASGLASNGGPTQTIADTASSPGKAHIPFSSGMCGYNGPAVDQRNFSRGAGGFCDIGAYELSGAVVTTSIIRR